MEEILSSIKRIIAEEGEEMVQPALRRGRVEAPVEIAVPAPFEEVLELTQEIVEEEIVAAAPKPAAAPKAAARPVAAAPEPGSILSVESEIAARQSLSALSSMLVSGDSGDNTLDGLVRSLLRPMLKEWLDARLPTLVEEMVAKEIARITAGR